MKVKLCPKFLKNNEKNLKRSQILETYKIKRGVVKSERVTLYPLSISPLPLKKENTILLILCPFSFFSLQEKARIFLRAVMSVK